MLGAMLFTILGAAADAPVVYFVLCGVYGLWRTFLDIYFASR